MFSGLGTTEIFIILAVLILLFGAKQIPKLAKSIGQANREFKNGWREIESDLQIGDAGDQRSRPQVKG